LFLHLRSFENFKFTMQLPFLEAARNKATSTNAISRDNWK
jgi:hypothetical protein